MIIDPRELTLHTIENLQELSAYLEDQAGGRVNCELLSSQARRCKEALLTITVLLPKLRTLHFDARPVANSRRHCTNCD